MMGKFSFDKNGNLVPYDIQLVTIEELEEEFVKSFEKSVTRKDIFDGHSNYLLDIFGILENNFFQWLDGSFVTQKLDPNDIDVVNFIYYTDATNEKAISLKKYLTNFGSPKEEYRVDGYLVPVYDPSDPRFAYTQTKYNEWRIFFGKDRNENPKGILQLNLVKNDK